MTGPYSTFRRSWPRVGCISIGDAIGDFDAAIDGVDNHDRKLFRSEIDFNSCRIATCLRRAPVDVKLRGVEVG